MTFKKKMLSLALISGLAAFALAGCGGGGGAEAEFDTETPISEQTGMGIQGIDPGAGIMEATTRALDEYGLGEAGWTLKEASDAAMMAELKSAYENKEAIIITGWTPHWMFSAYDLKYLEDPKAVYGGEENIVTIVRQGLAEDDPVAYEFLDNFYWEASDMEAVMNAAQDSDPESAAAEWVEANADKVDAWVEGLEPQEGKEISISYVAWDSEIASSEVVKNVLETRLGYKVNLVQLDAGPMYASVATGDTDAMVSAWLPVTHQDQYGTFEGQVENLGPNLEGTRIGLVVPTYMENINSIEDLLNN